MLYIKNIKKIKKKTWNNKEIYVYNKLIKNEN